MASRPSPSIPQDTVHLTLHLPPSASSTQSAATALAAQINDYITHELLPSDWIWHRDSLDLKVVKKQPSSKVGVRQTEEADEWRLQGLMRVGDSIEDEWVAVWLLKQITGKWEGVVGSIYDTDGDFLLIEAAQALPSWVTPSNSENRVWIADSYLHLIPLSVSSPTSTRPPRHERRLNLNGGDDDDVEDHDGGDGGGDGWLDEKTALNEIREGRWRDIGVEREAWERIASYPSSLKDHQQRTTLYLPTEIAKALARRPQLVQKAVETFYTRDPTQLRRAAKMPHFPPAEAVLTQITLTRTAYAQLKGQEFWPSKAFGREWTDPMGGDTDKDVIGGSSTPGEKEWRERGVKVAVGFEILCGESKARAKEYPALDTSAESSVARLSALRQDPEFVRYLETLERAGWFGEGELEGSAKWKEREAQAAKGWLEVRKDSEEDSSRPSFSTLFQAALSLPGPSAAAELAPRVPDDSEAWLDVNPADLETLMRERSSGMPGFAAAATGQDETMDVDEEKRGVEELESLAKKVAGFVDGKGEMDGALFDDEMGSDDSGIDDDQLERDLLDSDDEDPSDDEVVANMTSSMSLEEKEARKAKLVPGLDPAEWGLSTQKPQPTPPAPTSSTAKPSKPSKAAPSASSGPTPTFAPSASASALPIDGATRDLEEVDRQQKLKALLNDQAKALPPVKMRRPLLPRDSFDGVDSDDESDDEGQPLADASGKESKATLTSALGAEAEEEEDDDLPQVVGEVEVDMGQEEEEFLKFAREALGVDEGMWEGILRDREGRGSFVPQPKSTPKTPAAGGLKSAQLSSQPPSSADVEPASTVPEASASSTGDKAAPASGKSVRFTKPKPKTAAETTPMPVPEDPVVPGPPPRVRKPQEGAPDPTLDSFEAVMKRMDAELERKKVEAARGGAPTATTSPLKRPASESTSGSPKPTKRTPQAKKAAPASAAVPPSAAAPSAMDLDDEDDFDIDDPLLAMDAELRAALIAAGDVDSDDDLEGDGLEGDQAMDYNLIKNFLESFKSQGGMAGPVGNLVGRLGKKSGKE